MGSHFVFTYIMSTKIFLLVIISISMCAGCPDEWEYFGSTGKCYKFFKNIGFLSWAEAQTNCRNMQGQLAAVHSEELNMMLAGLTDGRNTWLGALRTGPDPFDNGSWIWMDGSSFDYDNWGSTQPDNLSGSEFCLHMNTHQGNWNDIDCVEKDPNVVASYICQVNQD